MKPENDNPSAIRDLGTHGQVQPQGLIAGQGRIMSRDNPTDVALNEYDLKVVETPHPHGFHAPGAKPLGGMSTVDKASPRAREATRVNNLLTIEKKLTKCKDAVTILVKRTNPSNSEPELGQLEISATRKDVPIICFCHLHWDWVWQRPQQFLSRLASKREVLFVETYRSETEHGYFKSRSPSNCPAVTVLEVHLPTSAWEDGEFIDLRRRQLVRDYLAHEPFGRLGRPALWFYDPMAVTAFAGHLDERAIVYDCMDELSQFKGAPPEMQERERALLAVADVVFCGGRKMQAKRLPLNPNCHFYGTGVDCAHFGRAISSRTKADPDVAKLGGPVLGYFGVIDERIDYELLDKLANARKDWNIAMVGPVAKVDPGGFPQRPNLHWLGARPYADLPSITKGFNVCLMPFALNAATEYINPTKALEYMAAGRPVVSTALDEVKANFGTVAMVAESHDDFIAHCEREAENPSLPRVRKGQRLAAESSWESIAAKMEGHLEAAISKRDATGDPVR